MPRTPEFDLAYIKAFRPSSNTKLFSCGRLWELTNTRYLLGMTAFIDLLNKQVDPIKQRFRVHDTFNVVPKPGINVATRLEELTAVLEPNGQFALLEFTGALPRAKLFPSWKVITNDDD